MALPYFNQTKTHFTSIMINMFTVTTSKLLSKKKGTIENTLYYNMCIIFIIYIICTYYNRDHTQTKIFYRTHFYNNLWYAAKIIKTL